MQEEWFCERCCNEFFVDLETLPMNGKITCPYCGEELGEVEV